MKILYFRMKGYINILQGMGLDEIVIPFTDMKSRIVLIQGINGSGKSTILRALSPEPDSSESFRRDVTVENGITKVVCYPGEKEIHYSDGTNIYKILFQHIPSSNKSTLSTKAFISKNGVELNPNGNVTSFKELRNDIFGINPIFLDMSIITSDKRGIVDMTPSNRRKYLASFIGSVDTFNSMYKIFSKKASLCKSRVNNLHTRIANIGDEAQLRLRLSSLKDQLKSLQNERETYIKMREEAETLLQVLDPNGELVNLQQSLLDDVGSTKSEMKKIDQQCDSIYRDKINLDRDRDISYYQEELNKTIEAIEGYTNTFNDYTTKIAVLSGSKDNILKSIESDKSRLRGISTDILSSNIKESIDDLRSKTVLLENAMQGYDVNDIQDISIDTLRQIKSIIENLKDQLNIFCDTYDNSTIEEIIGIIEDEKSISQIIDECRSELDKAKDSLNIIDKHIDSTIRDEEAVSKLSQRPDNCDNDNCPFIKVFIDISNKYKDTGYTPFETREKLEPIKHEINTKIKNISSRLTQLGVISNGIKQLEQILSSLSPFTQYYDKIGLNLDFHNICRIILNHDISLFDNLSVINDAISYLETKREYDASMNELKLLESEYKAVSNNEALINSLNSSITNHEIELEDINNKLSKYTTEVVSLKDIINIFKEHKNEIETLISLLKRKEELGNTLNGLKEKYDKAKNDLKTIDDKLNQRNKAIESLDRLDNNGTLTQVKEEIDRINYTLTSMIEYQEELKEYREKLERYTFMKDACSPGGGDGIQSAYVKMYMNEILSSCNYILSHMFQGTLQLGTPIIDENEFSIPFIGPWGLEVPDISNGSTAQKCMIGLAFACAAIMHSSDSGFIIPRFDEIDGGLDESNRISFIKVIDNILNIMNAEQCIMCSHNTEFDYTNTSRIICSHSGFTIQN